MKFLSKHFAENGKEKLSPNDSYLWATWKMPRRRTSQQPKFFMAYHSLQLLMLLIFQLKRVCNMWLLKETFGHFSRRLNIGTYFSCNTFAFRFVDKNFFQEMVLKTFLIPSLYIIWPHYVFHLSNWIWPWKMSS